MAGELVERLSRMSKKQVQKWLSIQNPVPVPTRNTYDLWELTYSAMITAMLMGMRHAQLSVVSKTFAEDSGPRIAFGPVTFDMAVAYLNGKVPLFRSEWDALEPLIRHRAFTVARLSELDAINRMREKIKEALETGKTLKEFWEESGADHLLSSAGFHSSNPRYWETVFRTNIQSAYNAGRRIQIMRDGNVKFLEFIGIRDKRQTEICRTRSGIIRPANEPLWGRNWPPLHFNCRSTVRPISVEESTRNDIKPTPDSDLDNIADAQDGFGVDPIQPSSFWRLPAGLEKRMTKYGILDEHERLAQMLGIGDTLELDQLTMPDASQAILDCMDKLNEIRKTYQVEAQSRIIIQKAPLISKIDAVGAARRHKSLIDLAPDLYDNIERIMSSREINTVYDAWAFKVLVHEFGHLLGVRNANHSFLYVSDDAYRILYEVVNDMWATTAFKTIAKKMGIKINVPPDTWGYLVSGYSKYVSRALKIFETAGLTKTDIVKLLDINTTIEPDRYVDFIEWALCRRLKCRTLPATIRFGFGKALVREDEYSTYLNEIRDLKKKRKKADDST
jgi:SPP1 gp7 family putative phage head morphogenesis protein